MLSKQLKTQIAAEAKQRASANNANNLLAYTAKAEYEKGAERYGEKWEAAEADRIEARKLLDEVFRKHETGLLPDRFVYEKIKNYLYPHKTSEDDR